MKIKYSLIAMLLCCIACDDTTDTIGIYTDSNNISAFTVTYEASTRSVLADSVLSSSNSSYLGCMTDAETGQKVKAEFLAQFSTLENYEFPSYDLMVKNGAGQIEADSIEIRLYYEKCYGSRNNPVKVEVWELDTTNVIREDSVYYSNADFVKYINKQKTEPIVRKVFTATDFTLSEDERENSSYTPNIRFVLPKEYGTFIINKFYENASFFKNSFNFIHHVCPGFYFRLSDGNGTMVKMRVGAMNLYFRYKDASTNEVFVGMTRFAATPEVIQNTYIENGDLKTLVQNNPQCTFLKTPAGVFTEMTIPVDEICQGHEEDSISQARVIFSRYNNQSDMNGFEIPQTILMVRKQDMYSFFEDGRIPDNETSYVASFNKDYNTYTFSNINRLVNLCRSEMYMNEDWNKVVLIPVDINRDNSNNIVSVSHDMGLGSTKLVGGTGSPVQVHVVYSSFR